MTTQEIANKLVEYCRTGQWEKAQNELYADNAVSIEPAGGPWPEHIEGREAIDAKGKQFNEMVDEMYGAEVSEPLVYGDQFSIGMTLDVKFKGGERTQSSEICVYEVKNGKISKEQFFYPIEQE